VLRFSVCDTCGWRLRRAHLQDIDTCRACPLESSANSPRTAPKNYFSLVHCHQQHTPDVLAGHAGRDCLSNAEDSYGAAEASQGAGEKTEFPTTAKTQVKAGYPSTVEVFRLRVRSRVLVFLPSCLGVAHEKCTHRGWKRSCAICNHPRKGQARDRAFVGGKAGSENRHRVLKV
jgi:hypothetical protein